MGYFYYVRHGETTWNVADKICGMTDVELTEKGHRQAKELAEEIVKSGIHVDEILYSPLIRARDTAMEISDVTGIPARAEKRLIEQCFGKWEGHEGRKDNAFTKDKTNFINSFEGGESMFKLAQRIYNLLDDIKKEADDKVYLLVAHNGISRVVESYFRDMTNEEYAAFGIKNCEIRKYEF